MFSASHQQYTWTCASLKTKYKVSWSTDYSQRTLAYDRSSFSLLKLWCTNRVTQSFSPTCKNFHPQIISPRLAVLVGALYNPIVLFRNSVFKCIHCFFCYNHRTCLLFLTKKEIKLYGLLQSILK